VALPSTTNLQADYAGGEHAPGPLRAYLSADARTIVTLAGHHLGNVTALRHRRVGYTGARTYVRVTMADGSRWYGSGAGPDRIVRLHPLKPGTKTKRL
jgi:hypothetical protein